MDSFFWMKIPILYLQTAGSLNTLSLVYIIKNQKEPTHKLFHKHIHKVMLVTNITSEQHSMLMETFKLIWVNIFGKTSYVQKYRFLDHQFCSWISFAKFLTKILKLVLSVVFGNEFFVCLVWHVLRTPKKGKASTSFYPTWYTWEPECSPLFQKKQRHGDSYGFEVLAPLQCSSIL